MSEQKATEVSATEPDWTREQCRGFWDPGRRLLRSIRRYQHWRSSEKVVAPLVRRYWVLQHRFWSVVTGADIPLNVQIGGGLLIPHPNGIVIHPHTRIGPNCLIFQQVTVGTRDGEGPPILGGHVDVGAGAKCLGAIRLGDRAKVGANAVVLENVPASATVVGIPARALGSGAQADKSS